VQGFNNKIVIGLPLFSFIPDFFTKIAVSEVRNKIPAIGLRQKLILKNSGIYFFQKKLENTLEALIVATLTVETDASHRIRL
jgi:hypothetical protein